MKAFCFSVFVCVAAAIAAREQSTDKRTQDFDWKIAQRFDDGRVVIMLSSDDAPVGDAERATVIGAEFSKPTTRYINRLWHASEEWVRRATGSAIKKDDVLAIDAGRAGWFEGKVTDFVYGAAGCGGNGGVIAGVATPQAEAFSHVKEKYFPVRIVGAWTPPAGASRVGPVPFEANAAQRSTIERLLLDELRRTSGPLLDAEDATNHTPNSLPWRRIYQRLASGEGRLRFDTQAFRITADGAPRLFVRATWTLDQRQVYSMGAWMRTSPEFSIDASDVHAAKYAWFTRMFDTLDLFWNGQVLNVSDIDRDGTAEVLMLFQGYESIGLQLLAYPPVMGSKVLATFAAGC